MKHFKGKQAIDLGRRIFPKENERICMNKERLKLHTVARVRGMEGLVPRVGVAYKRHSWRFNTLTHTWYRSEAEPGMTRPDLPGP